MKNNRIIKSIIIFVMIIATMLVFSGCESCNGETKKNYTLTANESVVVTVGESELINATVSGYDGTPEFSYVSSNDSIAKVENGYVIGVSAGSATITVSATIDGKTLSDTISVTVNAKQKATVTFIVDGQVYDSKEYDIGSIIELPENPTKQGDAQYSYTFEKWAGYEDGATVVGNAEYEAVFTVSTNSYVVKFVNEGVVVKEETLLYGEVINTPATMPTKQGDAQYSYTFDKWEGYENGATVVGNVEYTAKFRESVNEYLITFIANGVVVKEESLPYGSVITAPDITPTKQGDVQYSYAFEKWDGYKNGATVVGNAEYKAKFIQSINEYAVTFSANGEVVKQEILPYGSEIVLPQNPTKEPTVSTEYTFDRWIGYEEGATVNKNIQYVAQFSESVRKYDVKVFENAEEVYFLKVEYGSLIKDAFADFALSAPVGYEYSFEYEGELVVGDVNVIATKNKKEFTVTFLNGATVVKEEVLEFGSEIIAPDAPVKNPSVTTVYTFANWLTVEGDASTAVDFSKQITVSDNAVYYASFSESVRKYSVVFSVDGKVYKTSEQEYGEQVVLPEVEPVKAETSSTVYKFLYWKNYIAGDQVFGDMEYDAVFSETLRKFTVIYMVEDEEYDSQEIEYGNVISVDEPTKGGDGEVFYVFSHWIVDGAKFDVTTPITKDLTMTAHFTKAFAVRGKVEFPISYFNENYGKYYEASITCGNDSVTVNDDGSFTLILAEGTQKIVASCDGYERVEKTIDVSEDNTYAGTIVFTSPVYALNRISNANGVLTPAIGSSTTYQTALVKAKANTSEFIVRYDLNPNSNFMTHGEQFGFRLESSSTKLNLLLISSGIRVIFNNNWSTKTEFKFTQSGVNVSRTLSTPLNLVVKKEEGKFEISIYVNDVLAITKDLMQVEDFDAVSYKTLLSSFISEDISVGIMVNYSNNKYTDKAPLTISNLHYAYGRDVVESYENDLYTVSGKVTLPKTNSFGENLNLDISSVKLVINGSENPINADGTFSVKTRKGTKTITATVNGFIGANKQVQVNSDVADLDLEIKYYDFTTKVNGNASNAITNENGVLTPSVVGSQSYQSMTFKNSTVSNVLMITQTINPTSAYIKSKDFQQSAFYFEDAKTSENNFIILNLGNKLRILKNRTWSTLTEVAFEENINTNSYTEPFTLVAIVERDENAKSFIFKMYVNGTLVVNKDLATLKGNDGTVFANYLPFADMCLGVGANFASSGGFNAQTGSPITISALDYTTTKSIIDTYELSRTEFEVVINDENGNKQSGTTLLYGSLIPAQTAPKKDNDAQYTYSFKGWKVNGEDRYWNFDSDKVTGNITLTPVFERTVNTYTVIFKNEDGSEYAKYENVAYGSAISLPSAPVKENTDSTIWAFAGWEGYEEGMTVSGNHTFVAMFSSTSASYEVSFVNGEQIIKKETLVYGTLITAPDVIPTKAQDVQYTYSFKGWKNFVNGETTVSGNMTFEAEFNSVLRKYKVTYVVDDETIKEEEIEYGKNASLTEATKNDEGEKVYVFAHWSTSVDGAKFDGVITKDEILYGVFVVSYRTSGSVAFASGLADKYSNYNISESVVTIDGNSVSISSNGEFEQVLGIGEHTLVATHSKFESVTATLTVSEETYEWGEISFENHLMILDRFTYTNGELTPKIGASTTYQTALFNSDITANTFVIRQKVNPTNVYMANWEQIGFRIDGGENKQVNILIPYNQIRVIFNNKYDTYSEISFADTSVIISNIKTSYYLSMVVQRSESSFVVSIFVNDELVLSTDLAGVRVTYANTGVSYDYNDYLPFTETLKIGLMVNYSNNKYTEIAPLTLSDFDYSTDATTIENYFNGKVGISGRISLPSDLIGEDYIDEYASSVSAKVNGTTVKVNATTGLFTAVVDKNSTVTITASASGNFVASEKSKTVENVTIENSNVGVIALDGYIGKTGFTLSAGNTVDENGHIQPKEATYQRALITPNAKVNTFIVKHTVNPNELYVQQQTGKSKPNPQHGIALTDGTNTLAVVIENKNMRFINASTNKSQNVTGASTNPSLTTLTSPYTLTFIVTKTTESDVTTIAVDVFLTYTNNGSEVTIKLFDKSTCKIDSSNTVPVALPTGTITGVGACWHYSLGRYTAGAGFTVSDVHISDDIKVINAQQSYLNSLVSGL
ncbi:MAG: hypothetical protein E7353_01805 [Clostridiales bacterium]|nr:hypothetical protein [Clostridiales bacterium]